MEMKRINDWLAVTKIVTLFVTLSLTVIIATRTYAPAMADEVEFDEEEEEDRRVVYVGKIRRNSTTKTKLRKRFER